MPHVLLWLPIWKESPLQLGKTNYFIFPCVTANRNNNINFLEQINLIVII